MRVFYEDITTLRTYYVKLDNVDVPDDLKGFKSIDATSTEELIEKIKKVFRLRQGLTISLWSNSNYIGKRLDTVETIPKENEFIYARVLEC
jgi:hypothetical protein